MYSNLWVEEIFHDVYGTKFKTKSVLFSEKGPFQTVDVIETQGHGRMLLNDGMVMTSDRDEFVYHEMISHVPLFSHPLPKKVLIIGGGDGGTAREVLKHSSVERCVMVEIDPLVIDAAKKYLPQTSGPLTNSSSRFELRVEDGLDFMAKSKEQFDVILIDSTDPVGPAEPLFNLSFYQDIYNRLSEQGIVVSQCESAYYAADMQEKILSILKQLFPHVALYNYTNCTYPGGLWSFSFASKNPAQQKISRKEESTKFEEQCSYYTTDLAIASFALPKFMKKRFQSFLS